MHSLDQSPAGTDDGLCKPDHNHIRFSQRRIRSLANQLRIARMTRAKIRIWANQFIARISIYAKAYLHGLFSSDERSNAVRSSCDDAISTFSGAKMKYCSLPSVHCR